MQISKLKFSNIRIKSASVGLIQPFLFSVLHEGRGRHSGGHFGGVSDNRGEEAAGGEGDSQEDICFFLPHHQGSGGQHGATGGPADKGETPKLKSLSLNLTSYAVNDVFLILEYIYIHHVIQNILKRVYIHFTNLATVNLYIQQQFSRRTAYAVTIQWLRSRRDVS